MNIRIYLYQENDMNEYSNIFVSKIIQIWYEWIFVLENIQMYEYVHKFFFDIFCHTFIWWIWRFWKTWWFWQTWCIWWIWWFLKLFQFSF
jgi:hypothetical protein